MESVTGAVNINASALREGWLQVRMLRWMERLRGDARRQMRRRSSVGRLGKR